MRFLTELILVAVFAVAAGCARHEFDIVRPANLAQHVGTKHDAVLPVPPLEYRMRAREGRLVIAIVNQDDRPITLRGEQSFVVDPRGQSHPLRSLTIAPGTYVKLVLPPLESRRAPSGPTFGIGIGTVIGSADAPDPVTNPPVDPELPVDRPRYLMSYEDDDGTRYWRWDGETEVRMTLVYDRAGEQITQDFVVRRVRV